MLAVLVVVLLAAVPIVVFWGAFLAISRVTSRLSDNVSIGISLIGAWIALGGLFLIIEGQGLMLVVVLLIGVAAGLAYMIKKVSGSQRNDRFILLFWCIFFALFLGSMNFLGSIDGTASSAICMDGTSSNSRHRQGTCSHHGGLLDW